MKKIFEKKLFLNWINKEKDELNYNIKWVCESIGLFPVRDYDSSMYRLFLELLKDAKKNQKSTSDELAYKLNLTRGTVIHHLNKFIVFGLVEKEKNKYYLKEKNMKDIINFFEKETKKLFEELKKIAEKIDEEI